MSSFNFRHKNHYFQWITSISTSKGLANATEALGEQIPSQRPGKEEINWDERLAEAFRDVQLILLKPEAVFVPRKDDHLYISVLKHLLNLW